MNERSSLKNRLLNLSHIIYHFLYGPTSSQVQQVVSSLIRKTFSARESQDAYLTQPHSQAGLLKIPHLARTGLRALNGYSSVCVNTKGMREEASFFVLIHFRNLTMRLERKVWTFKRARGPTKTEQLMIELELPEVIFFFYGRASFFPKTHQSIGILI